MPTEQELLTQKFKIDFASARMATCQTCGTTDRNVISLIPKYGTPLTICGMCSGALGLALQDLRKFALLAQFVGLTKGKKPNV